MKIESAKDLRVKQISRKAPSLSASLSASLLGGVVRRGQKAPLPELIGRRGGQEAAELAKKTKKCILTIISPKEVLIDED